MNNAEQIKISTEELKLALQGNKNFKYVLNHTQNYQTEIISLMQDANFRKTVKKGILSRDIAPDFNQFPIYKAPIKAVKVPDYFKALWLNVDKSEVRPSMRQIYKDGQNLVSTNAHNLLLINNESLNDKKGMYYSETLNLGEVSQGVKSELEIKLESLNILHHKVGGKILVDKNILIPDELGLNERYPDYKRVIPNTDDIKPIEISVLDELSKLKGLIELAKPYILKEIYYEFLGLKGEVTNPISKEVSTVPMYFHTDFLFTTLESLRLCGVDKAEVYFTGTTKALVIKANNILTLTMPKRKL